MENLVQETREKMESRLAGLDRDLSRTRTGRASISMLDGINVDYYGSPTALNQVATLSTPDARMIVVSPFEKSLIPEIEKAIFVADLGITPTNDGVVVRIPVPQLTEERRKEIVKGLKKVGEDAKVSIRKIRRDANEAVKKSEKAKEITEDDNKRLQADIQKVTDEMVKKVDEKLSSKEKEVMTI